MKTYELVFITEKEKDELLKNVETLIQDLGGSVASKEKWGKKQFAYPMKKKAGGYYFSWQIQAPQSKIQALKGKLDFEEDVIRYLLISN